MLDETLKSLQASQLATALAKARFYQGLPTASTAMSFSTSSRTVALAALLRMYMQRFMAIVTKISC